MAKSRGLGRGLDALLAGDSESSADTAPQNLPVEAIKPGRYQPRAGMDPAALGELVESIKAQGILQPILVRPVTGGQYEIIAGERRWRAAQMAGLATVPVAVKDIPDEAALAAALIENIQREDLNPLEEASGIQRLIKEFGMTHEAAAQAVGRSRSAVTNLLRLLNLAQPVRELLLSNQIEMGHARALLALSVAKQAEVAHVVVRRRLSVRETEKLVARELQQQPITRALRVDRDVQRLENELSDQLGATVTIRSNKDGAGRVSINFGTLAELDGIVAKLKR